MDHFKGPPLQINRGFLHDKDNILKLGEVLLGIVCAVFNSYCFPNIRQMCTNRVDAFPQIFSIICINVFFVVITAILAFCNLFGVMDTFYKYNFPMLEKFIISLATFMYAVSSVLILIATLDYPFTASWLLPLFFTLWTCTTYAYDAKKRWTPNEC